MKHWASLALGLALLLAGATGASAQGVADTLAGLQPVVAAGDTVSVTDRAGQEVTGRITTLSPASLTLLVDGRSREWQESDIVSIRRRHRDSLVNGVGWGAMAGLAAGLVAVIATHETAEDEGWPLNRGLAVGLAAGAGAAIGAAVDSGITERRVIFERRQGTGPSFGMSAALGRTKAGIGFSVGF